MENLLLGYKYGNQNKCNNFFSIICVARVPACDRLAHLFIPHTILIEKTT